MTDRKKNNKSTRSGSSSKRSSSSRKRTPSRKKKQSDVSGSVALIVSLFAGIFIFISNLGAGGKVGSLLSDIMFGLFGLLNFLLPFLIIILAIFYVLRRNDLKNINSRLVISVILYLTLTIYPELLKNRSDPIGARAAYFNGFYDHSGGGFTGGLLSDILVSLFSLAGAYLIVIIADLIMVIFLIGFSLTDLLADLKEAHDEKKAIREKEEEEREKEREERRKREEKRTSLPRRKNEGETESNRRDKPINDGQPVIIRTGTPRKKSRANSNIHPGRHEHKEDEGPELLFDPSLPRRERKVRGTSFNTRLTLEKEPVSAGNDDMNEISPDDLTSMAEDSSINTVIEPEEEKEDITVNDIRLFSEDPSSDWTDIWMKRDESGLDKEADESSPLESDSYAAAEPIEPSDSNIHSPQTMETFTEEYRDGHSPEYDLYSDRKSSSGPAERAHDMPGNMATKAAAASKASDPVSNAGGEKTEPVKPREYIFPPTSILSRSESGAGNRDSETEKTAVKLNEVLKNFGVNAKVTGYSRGPSVTRYEVLPDMGVKVSRIVNLSDDIKMNLAATDIRIEAPIPGKSAVGIEVPNKEKTVVGFRELAESDEFRKSKSKIAFALGRDLSGRVVISDIQKMPHLLIAGATGSGKSVCINTIIMSILYKARPDEVKFIMIDPKVVELSVYNGIPHLLIPVVTDPKKAAGALQWVVKEMMDRYKKFSDCHVRDMEHYNSLIHDGQIEIENGGQSLTISAAKMPQLVVIVDELADLMMTASKEVEEAICRIAQLARAAGIHLVIATQRPSVNVITGLIKANMPSRIAFSVTSGVDSRTILDMNGAEKLLGKGDMLYYPQGLTKPVRVQGAFMPDSDVAKTVRYIKEHNKDVEADNSDIMKEVDSAAENHISPSIDEGSDNGFDEYFADAARLLIEKDKGSIGMLQRNFKIGFNRAARIMDQLEEFGVVGPETGTKPRKILVTLEQFEEMLKNEGGN